MKNLRKSVNLCEITFFLHHVIRSSLLVRSQMNQLPFSFILFVCLAQVVCAFQKHNSLFLKRNSQRQLYAKNIKFDSEEVEVIVVNNNWKKKMTSIATAIALSTCMFSHPVLADGGDEKESKKSFETCYSVCMFEMTRPPPLGASAERLEANKPRTEILRECRVKCAKTKDQLLMGKPKAIKTPQTEAPKQQ